MYDRRNFSDEQINIYSKVLKASPSPGSSFDAEGSNRSTKMKGVKDSFGDGSFDSSNRRPSEIVVQRRETEVEYAR